MLNDNENKQYFTKGVDFAVAFMLAQSEIMLFMIRNKDFPGQSLLNEINRLLIELKLGSIGADELSSFAQTNGAVMFSMIEEALAIPNTESVKGNLEGLETFKDNLKVFLQIFV